MAGLADPLQGRGAGRPRRVQGDRRVRRARRHREARRRRHRQGRLRQVTNQPIQSTHLISIDRLSKSSCRGNRGEFGLWHLKRFKAEISSSISKTAPDFSTVYVVSKGGKVTSVRQAVRQAPAVSPLRTMIQGPKPDNVSTQKWTPPPPPSTTRPDIAGTPKIQDNFIM